MKKPQMSQLSSHTALWRRFSAAFATIIFLICAGVCFLAAMRFSNSPDRMTVFDASTSPNMLRKISTQALESPIDIDRARTALEFLAKKEPMTVGVWNRLAYLDRLENGIPTKEGLAALLQGYEVSPFGDLDMMIWRVDFASAHWSAMPTSLREKTLSQIPIIARFGISYDWRRIQCRTNPHPSLYEPICASAPEVVRPNS